jgi:hypothetical protein
MKFKNKRKNYIWFHQEEQNMEPNFNSYYFSHMHENSPRKYKVIIRVSDLEKERMLVRPSNNNVIIMNDLEVPGIIYTKYNSYNTKFYLKKCLMIIKLFKNIVSNPYDYVIRISHIHNKVV